MTTPNTSLSGDTQNTSSLDVVSDASDHHFTVKNQKNSTTINPTVHKKIMQEWKLLAKDLPENIYVRVYETRVDLIRAAIVGARGTPYHDGLFFFDIAFPWDYPAKPPLVYYHSFGYRINPNLYSNGRVCLSLLNTWTGKKSEKWDPKNSTILQVLLSIQALVLNEKPYFNEPGSTWSGKTYGEKKSSAYSEGVFLLNCRTMLLVLRKPPKNFEPLVTQHFRDRAEFILNACDVYRKGLARVGFFNGVVGGRKQEVSVKFKEPMDQLFGDLAMALSKTGASVGDIVKQVEEERGQRAKEKEAATAAAKNKEGVNVGKVGKSIVKKLQKFVFLGWIIKDKREKSSKELKVVESSNEGGYA